MGSLVAALDRALAHAARPDEELYRTTPVSAWCVARHLDHVAKASLGCLGAANRIVAGKGDTCGSLRLTGRLILWFGRIPRGKGQAPPSALPEDRPSRDAIREGLGAARAAAQAIDPAALARAKGTVAHHHLGALRARQWMRFAAIHARHHLALIEDILRG